MIGLKNATLRFADKLIFDNASFLIREGQKVGLVGANGAGKSTLFRLFLGDLELQSGDVFFPQDMFIGIMEQNPPSDERSILQATLEADVRREKLLKLLNTAAASELDDIHQRLHAIGANSAESRAARILLGLGFSNKQLEQSCSDFSGGWQMRVSLARLLFSEPDLLLLDEPTNHLDFEAVIWLNKWLKSYNKTVVLISHDKNILNEAVDNILHLDEKKFRLYGGNYDNFIKLRSELQENLKSQKAKQDKQKAHMQKFVDRFRYKDSKAKQAQSRIKMIAKMQDIEQLSDYSGVEFKFSQPQQLASPIIKVERLSCGYEEDKPILKNMNFRIDMDSKIGLLGSNGNGKTTFMRLLNEQISWLNGTLQKDNKLTIGYFSQDQADILPKDVSALDYIAAIKTSWTQQEVQDYLGRFGFGIEHVFRNIDSFSGGEKARLVLAKVVLDKPNLLLLDEPTNHLDIASRENLLKALLEYSGGIIIVSHDSWILEHLCDELWIIENNSQRIFDGDLNDYSKYILEKNTIAYQGGEKTSQDNSDKVDKKDLRKQKALLREKTSNLRADLKSVEQKLKKLEQEKQRLMEDITSADIFTQNPQLAKEINENFGRVQKEIAELESSWFDINEKIDSIMNDVVT